MIVGAGLFQVPIIRCASQMGFQTVVVSIRGNYPGLKIADKAYEIDVREKEEILAIAKQEKICGILTDQTDIPVTTVAYVAENLGLPGIGYECAVRFTNKFRMRSHAQKIGVPGPAFFQASTFEEARQQIRRIGFPAVIKPVDNQGSRGVARVDTYETLEEKFNAAIIHSACRKVIIEECLSGIEIVVQGFASDFKFSNLVIGDRKYFNIPGLFIPSQTLFPTLLNDDLRKKVLDINYQLITGFAPQYGITHSEYLVDEQTGDVRLIEVAIRGGGVFISSDLVPLASGIDVNKMLIDAVSGKNSHIDMSSYKNEASAYVCFYLPEGTINRIEGVEKILALPGVHKGYFDNIKPGKQIYGLTDKTMRQGPILVKAKDRENLEEIISRLKTTLLIDVETSRGTMRAIW